MSEQRVVELLERTPVDRDAEERAWELVRAAFAEREPVRRRPRLLPAIALSVVVAAAVAAASSSSGRAVVHAVGRSLGIAHAQPALYRLPAAGRLLVSGAGGAWVVSSDGSTRSLGPYEQASWSPHGRFVVGATQNRLAALAPDGTVHWTLARALIRFPRWGGTLVDTRIAYLTVGRLHVVAGDGTNDGRLEAAPDAARVVPAWRPSKEDRHVLAYVATGGRAAVVDADRSTLLWISPAYAGARALAWSADGSRLALATRDRVVVFDGRSGRIASTIRVAGVRALAYGPDGRLALLRPHAIVLREGRALRTLFVPPGGTVAGLAWSPDGRWLLTGLPAADEWVFLQTHGKRILAVSHIAAEFGGFPSLDGWAPGA